MTTGLEYRNPRSAVLRAGLILALGLGSNAAALEQEAKAETPQAPPMSVTDGHWHFIVGLYGWFPSLSGAVTVANFVPVPIDLPFSDLSDHLKFVMTGHFEGRRDRFGFGSDLFYVHIGAPIQGAIPEDLNAKVDMRQWIVEGFGFYRIAQGQNQLPWTLDALGGVRYWSTNVRAQSDAGETDPLTTDWVDGFGGVRFQLPITSWLSLIARGDAGGGGAKLEWDASGDLAFQLGKGWVSGLGYKYLSVDYEQKSELGILNRRAFDVTYSGPRAWIAYTW